MHFEPVSTILLEDGDDHTNDVVVVVDDDDDDDGDGYGDGDGDGDDDDDDDDDNDPAELFQKRGKWWELILLLPYVLYLLHVCIYQMFPSGADVRPTFHWGFRRCDLFRIYFDIFRTVLGFAWGWFRFSWVCLGFV